MATPSIETRSARRRAAVIDEALDHALAVMTEDGVGALSVSEVARRMGMRGPSLYKYFSSLHALYDALFARGLASLDHAVEAAVADREPGLPRLLAGAAAIVRWCTENPALAQLLFWRVVPGFEPSPETFRASIDSTARARHELDEAVRRGELTQAASTDDALRLFTVVISGVISQQLANEPGAAFEDGRFTRLTDDALQMFVHHYARRP